MGLLRDVDRLLRGEYSRTEDLAQGRITAPIRSLLLAGFVFGGIYGVFMGLYSALRPENPSLLQLVATTVKVPLLFFLTLLVTFPSLYVFSALGRSPLKLGDTLRLLLGAVAVNVALLASLGPVVGFFTLSTESYAFMVLLNVVFFAIAGMAGVGFARSCLRRLFGSDAGAASSPSVPPQATAKAASQPQVVLRAWIVIYGVVGAQMGWILRPFVGHPELDFALFRQRESNFFEAVFRTIGNLFS